MRYHPPATPCARLLASSAITEATKERLKAARAALDPLHLLDELRTAQHQVAALVAGAKIHVPRTSNADLEGLLAGLGTAWRTGEVRPTHAKAATAPHWQTRKKVRSAQYGRRSHEPSTHRASAGAACDQVLGQRLGRACVLRRPRSSGEAHDHVARIEKKIVLIDSPRLAALLFDHGSVSEPEKPRGQRGEDEDFLDERHLTIVEDLAEKIRTQKALASDIYLTSHPEHSRVGKDRSLRAGATPTGWLIRPAIASTSPRPTTSSSLPHRKGSRTSRVACSSPCAR